MLSKQAEQLLNNLVQSALFSTLLLQQQQKNKQNRKITPPNTPQ